MKRYLLGAILVGNLAISMDKPEIKGESLSAEILEKIEGIKQSAKESLLGLYPNVDIHNPKDAVEKAVAETILEQQQWEQSIPTMSKKQLYELWPKVSGWYWSDFWKEKINNRLKELDRCLLEIAGSSREQLAAKYLNINLNTDIGQAVANRVSELQEIELRNELRQDIAEEAARESRFIEEARIATKATSKYQDQLDLIASMKRQELTDYQLGFNDPELPRSSSETEVIGKAIAARHAQLDALNRTGLELPIKSILKPADPERALSPKKGHITFTGVPSDSDGSGIARPAVPSVTETPAALQPAEFNDSNSRVVCPSDSSNTPDLQEISLDSDFEEKISLSTVDTHATPAISVKTGTDLVSSPVLQDTDPLAREATPASIGQLPARIATQSPSISPRDFKSEPSQSPAPDTSGDAELAASLTEQGRQITPGGPEVPQLAIEPISPANGASQRANSTATPPKTAGVPTWEQLSEKIEDIEKKHPDLGQPDNSYSTTQKVLMGVGVAAAVYASTEVVLAYKSITPAQWKDTPGLLNKAKLVLNKTCQQVKSRPAQGLDLLKKLAGKRSALA